MTRPARTPLEELRRSSASMIPGTLDGRIAEARLIFHGGTGGSLGDFTDEGQEAPDLINPPIKFYQDRHVVTETGEQIIRLSYVPMENSEHLYWGRLFIDQSYWTRTENLISVPDRGFHVGDIINVEYAYENQGPIPELDGHNLIVVGSTQQSVTNNNGSSNPIMYALPAGTQAGDLMILAILGGSLGGDANCTDPRLTTIDQDPYLGSQMGGWPYYLGWGRVGSDTSDIPTIQQGSGHATGQYTVGVLLVLRNPTGQPIYVEKPWTSWSAGPYDGDTARDMATISRTGQTNALAVWMSRSGAGGVGSPNWDKNDYVPCDTTPWSNTYCSISIGQLAYVDGVDTEEQITPGQTETFREHVIGLLAE